MREVDRSSDAKRGAPASSAPRAAEPRSSDSDTSDPDASEQRDSRPSGPPSSVRFIGTNIDVAQAYIPPTAPLDSPEPPVPDSKVALSAAVDPRKAPTHPNLKNLAKQLLVTEPADAPVIEAPPDSQPSGMRRGAGYAPSRSQFPPASSGPRVEAPQQRLTPIKPFPKVVPRVTPVEPVETPQQRRATLLLIFLFAALLAVAVYFLLLRRAPPAGPPPTVSAAVSAPAPVVPASTPTAAPVAPTSASTSAEPAPSSSASASAAPSAEPSPPAPVFVPPRTTSPGPSAAPHDEPTAPPAAPPPSGAPIAAPSATSTAAPAGSDKPKSGRWF